MRKSALVTPPDVRFSNVAGCDEAVEELQEVVLFLREPWRFSKVGARMPRGVILHGPPGTGKTLLAKAVAGESGVPFFAVAGSDFVETFVGVGAARVRDLFAEARKSKTGAIIFFDEIDAIGRARSGGSGSGADSEREGTLNQLLVELDGFGERDRIVVVAATNRVDMLDAALLRAGRFDRRVQVSAPGEAGRLEIMKLHSKGMPLQEEEDLKRVAAVTAGFAGSDLSNLLNEAAIMAARDGRERITAADLDEGMLRALAGPQKRDGGAVGNELEAIAWHEAGHCLAAELSPTHAKTQRVTILARGGAGGLALYGNTDRALTSRRILHEQMVVVMAGRAAEHVGVGTISSGAANDLERANEMARAAVERLGFSEAVGQIVSASGPNAMPLSHETRSTIDREVARMVATAYSDAVTLLSDHRDQLERLTLTLKEREQLDRAQIEEVLADVIGEDAIAENLPADPEPLPVVPPASMPTPAGEPGWTEPSPARETPAPEPEMVPEPSLAAALRALWRQRRRSHRAPALRFRLRRTNSQVPPAEG
jgi:cell division protease FtsH